MHQQTAYKDFPVADGGLPVSEQLSDDVISLPIHAYPDEASARDRVIRKASTRGAAFCFPPGFCEASAVCGIKKRFREYAL